MPYKVLTDLQQAPASPGAFLFQVQLWPHQSLTGTGFVWVMGLFFGLISLPLIALVGTVVMWGILPFAMGAVALLWLSLHRNWRDRDILETFSLTPDAAMLVRRDPDGTERAWKANPYWVRVERHEKVGQVEDYLTLTGGERVVELGAFLTPEERRALEGRLLVALSRAKAP
ncbi:DUF2244 domain-containing protein [Jannaschia rubra]|uniref:Integral membrane protein n=1 Tax=Jannaschia rubra TaxID=282197 RepID=A0A0M6XS74_9RHOB|nr:DUF2244 domain-containing protein [Jannaschia rubra]CTQ32894.1 hypothetical protein JAN5088_01667 [Jannaschia rubra]SFG28234.1 Uncharacterized membrane protein [Jannaschia rubra]